MPSVERFVKICTPHKRTKAAREGSKISNIFIMELLNNDFGVCNVIYSWFVCVCMV